MFRPHIAARHALFRCRRPATRRISSVSPSRSAGTSSIKKRVQLGAVASAVVAAFLDFNDHVFITSRNRHLVIPRSIEHAVSPYIRRFREGNQADRCPPSHLSVRALNSILLHLQQHPDLAHGSPWQATLIEDWSHSYAACGVDRMIYISQRMLHDAQSEDELAWILAHELAHGLARHRWEIAGNMSIYLVIAPITGIVLATFSTAIYGLALVRRSELEADAIGMTLMAGSRYDPTAAIDMMSRIEWASVASRHRKGLMQQIRALPPFRRHPEPAIRLAKMKTLLPQTKSIFEANKRGSAAPSSLA